MNFHEELITIHHQGELKEAMGNFESGIKSVDGDFKFICNYELGEKN